MPAHLGTQDQKPYSVLESKQITEMSGIAKSKRFRDTYWVHNDSGDSARIFAIHLNGESIGSQDGISVKDAKNVDWEDIIFEGDNLVISDMGNNGNKRHNLGVYVVTEPDPTQDHEVTIKEWIPIAYPDQTEFPPKIKYEFDCEALFALRGKLYFITKHRNGAHFPSDSAKLYRLDTRYHDRTNTLTLVDRAEKLGGWVTSASLSPDGKTLAVLAQLPFQSVWLFDTSVRGDKFLSGGHASQISLGWMQQSEGICWDDSHTLIVTNEQGEIYKLDTKGAKKVR